MKYSFDVQSVCGASFKVSAALEFGGQKACPGIGNQSRVGLTDGVLSSDKYQRAFTHRSTVLHHLGVVCVDGVETHLTL